MGVMCSSEVELTARHYPSGQDFCLVPLLKPNSSKLLIPEAHLQILTAPLLAPGGPSDLSSDGSLVTEEEVKRKGAQRGWVVESPGS